MKKKINGWLALIVVCSLFLMTACNEEKPQEDVTHEVWVNVNGEEDFYDVKDGETFDVTPTLKDYVFVGWYLDEALTTKFDSSTKVTEDLTLYAKFSKATCEVRFNANGGTGSSLQKVKYGEKVTVPTTRPSKLYGEFEYWCTDEAGTNPYNFESEVTEDFVLYAKYKTVSYDDVLDSLIPDTTSGDLNFTTLDTGLNYIWSSSNENIISNTGLYMPAREDKKVTITLQITCGGSSEKATYSKEVLVKGYHLDTLVPGNVIMGYSSSWYLGEYVDGYSEELLNTVNVINISFAYVNSDATLVTSDLTRFPKYITEAHEKGIRVCLSIQGGESNDGTKGFSDCAADATLRKKLAKAMADAVVQYNLDGIDIDWEYPGSYKPRVTQDKYNYTLLMEEIRAALDELGDDYLLTAAIPGGSWGAGVVEMTKVSKIFDYVNMMSYDLEGSDVVRHHTALHPSSVSGGTTKGASIEEAVKLWHDTYDVPYEKITIGMAFYAKPMIAKKAGNTKVLGNVKTTSSKNIRYRMLLETYFSEFGKENYRYYYDYDESAEAPYIYSQYGTNSDINYFISYDNERSIIAKCNYAKELGLGGVMIWELGEDCTNTLVTATAQGMGKHLDGKAYIVAGSYTLEKNTTINLKTVEEVMLSANPDVIYEISDNSLATIKDNVLTLNNAGTLTVYAKSSTGTIYGKMVITIK